MEISYKASAFRPRLITDMIRDDVGAGRYGLPGRPNVQSIHEMILATPSQLESLRGSIDELLRVWSEGDDTRIAKLFETSLQDHWSR